MKNLIRMLILLGAFASWAVGSCEESKQNNTWYFGKGLKLDFNGPTTNVLVEGNSWIRHGNIAGISDENGEILFYSDGSNIRNKDHEVLPTDRVIGGTRPEGLIAIPRPGNPDEYYLFTHNGTLSYFRIDMNQDGGKGDVVEKVDFTGCCSSNSVALSATYHANGEDIWLFSHGANSGEYNAYLVTSAGVLSLIHI